MNDLPDLCVVDTNVPIVANYAINSQGKPEDLDDTCVSECIRAIEHVRNQKNLVIDNGDEILSEYRNNLSSERQGIGNSFLKWVFDHQYTLPQANRVSITRDGDIYTEFPENPALADFDQDDRKFVAVANAHEEAPSILQATDREWWGYRDALQNEGINVHFLCPEYVSG